MGFYIFATLVLGFIAFIIVIAIKWEIDFRRWMRPIRSNTKRHTKETLTTSATDITTTPPGFNDVALHSTITSATHGFDSKNDLNHFETGNYDSNTYSDSGYDNSSDSGGYDSGGYDSGGGGGYS